MEQERKHLDLDTFGEIIDDFIHKNEVGLMVLKEANSDDWEVTGVGMGAVMDFFIFLNALEPIYLAMLEQMEGRIDAEKLAESLSDLMKECMITAAEEKGA
ncbi:MAG: hypothetical protein II000_10110 [Clostridia bacterium]|nr:hypothetical protein [Clostridia bacterium]